MSAVGPRRRTPLVALLLLTACEGLPSLPTGPSSLTRGVILYEHANFLGNQAHLESSIEDLKDFAGEVVTVRGWVTHVRSSGKVAFVVLRDGSGVLQSVLVKNAVGEEVWERFASLTLETSLAVTGEVPRNPSTPVLARGIFPCLLFDAARPCG